jgi:Protein of unknown function (DUF2735)
MTANFSQESAKIYQFPATGRKTVEGRREEINSTIDLTGLRVSAAAFGSGWYHEAAIQESKRIRER